MPAGLPDVLFHAQPQNQMIKDKFSCKYLLQKVLI